MTIEDRQQHKPQSYLLLRHSVGEQQLADLRRLHRVLIRSLGQPSALDCAAIDRVLALHQQMLEAIALTRRRLDRRSSGIGAPPAGVQPDLIQRVHEQTAEIERLVREIISIAQRVKVGTIDRVLAVRDFGAGWSAPTDVLPGTPLFQGAQVTGLPRSNPDALAADIDARMTKLGAAGLTDSAIFEVMAEYLPALSRLLDHELFDGLCLRHPGLERYTSIVNGKVLKLLEGRASRLSLGDSVNLNTT